VERQEAQVRLPRARVALLKAGVLGVLAAFVVAGIVALAFQSASPDGDLEILLPTATPLQPVVVYVTGAVGREGLYSMRAGDRAADAIALAGGLLPEADRARVDGAAPLHDGDHVHVPRLSEPAQAQAPGMSSIRLDLNRATQQQLESLPGIGPVLAKAILDHRAKIGRFASVEQLLDVSGIGPTTLARLRPLVEAR
jgi:competence protein ComEA